jgi:AraC-like DNA-binding protein
VVSYIRKNISRPLYVGKIAYELGVDPGNLDRCFRNAYGFTIKQCIDKQKKTKLLKLLANNEKYGYEIAYEIGFRNDLSFYRWVKRVTGRTYTELTKENMRK